MLTSTGKRLFFLLLMLLVFTVKPVYSHSPTQEPTILIIVILICVLFISIFLLISYHITIPLKKKLYQTGFLKHLGMFEQEKGNSYVSAENEKDSGDITDSCTKCFFATTLIEIFFAAAMQYIIFDVIESVSVAAIISKALLFMVIYIFCASQLNTFFLERKLKKKGIIVSREKEQLKKFNIYKFKYSLYLSLPSLLAIAVVWGIYLFIKHARF